MKSCKNSLGMGKSWLAQLKERELKGIIRVFRWRNDISRDGWNKQSLLSPGTQGNGQVYPAAEETWIELE